MSMLTFKTLASDGGLLERLFFRGPGQTGSAVATDALFLMIFWFSMFFFVLLMGLMFYWVVKYRRRPGVPAPVSPSHNTPLEIFWTVVPSSSLLVIFLLGFWGYMGKMVAEGDAIELRVSAWMWGWDVTYPSGASSQEQVQLGASDVPVFVVPEDTPIKLRMSSQDVIHAFWIPAFRVKMDVYPNRYTGYAFRTPSLESGEEKRDLWIFCAEYCGDLHAEMGAVLRVVPRRQYVQTLQGWDIGDMSPVEIGELVWRQRCQTCHSVDGSRNAGPTWQGGRFDGRPQQYYGYGYPVTLTDGREIERDADYIRRSIILPQADVVVGYPNNMPSFSTLQEAQLEGLIAFIRSLSDRGPPTDIEDDEDAENGRDTENDDQDEEDAEPESAEGAGAPAPSIG